MTYKHTEDIEGTGAFDPNELDKSMELMVSAITAGFNRLEEHPSTFKSLMEVQFQTFLSTHKGIRLLLQETSTVPYLASDALSLVREQVEKIFNISLILDDPNKWILDFFKDDWRRFYKYEVLVLEEERKDLPRHQRDKAQRNAILKVLKDNARITPLEEELVRHKFFNPSVTKPAHLEGVDIPRFPTPSEAIKAVSDSVTKEALRRWHYEYEYICGYSHIGLEKLQLYSMWNVKTSIPKSNKQAFLDTVRKYGITISYVATASACVEGFKYLIKYDLDFSRSNAFVDAALAFWTELKKQSLWGKLFWDIHAEKILPHVINPKQII